jgi:hypothetical protein
MGQKCETENGGGAPPILCPRRVTEEDGGRHERPNERKDHRVGQRAMRYRPAEVVDIRQCGAGRGNQADATRGRRLLPPRRYGKANRCVGDGCRHQRVRLCVCYNEEVRAHTDQRRLALGDARNVQ